ncbi:MAG: hypothetical protein ACM3XR_02905 [Bacillota bacterium]
MDEKILELKSTIKELIVNIITRINEISSHCKNANSLDKNRLINLFDDLQALAEGINIIKEYNENIDMLEFHEKLDIMGRALEENDVMLFLDIMQYELADLLEYWKQQLD